MATSRAHRFAKTVELSEPRAELEDIRLDCDLLGRRVGRLVDPIAAAELVGNSPITSEPASAASYTSAGREDAARATGQFFVRCLTGQLRGDSGRSRIRLQNRVYVVLLLLMARDFERNLGLPASSAKRVVRGELDLAAGFTKLLRGEDRTGIGFHKGDGLVALGFISIVFPKYMYAHALTAIQNQFPQHLVHMAS